MSTNRKDAAVKKAALKLAQQLEKSCEAMHDFNRACLDAEIPFRGIDDGRAILLEDMREFSAHLTTVHGKKGGSS